MTQARTNAALPVPPTGGSFPGFDGIRLLASISVLVSHAFIVAEGSEAREPLTRLLGKGNIVGHYGVYTFFIISGFLLTRSLSRDPDAVSFTRNRVLRIVPGFAFCTAFLTLVIGPMVTALPFAEYLRQPATLPYILQSVGCFCDYWPKPFVWPIEGDYASELNGSLWSLSYEVLSYVFLLWLWILLRRPMLVAAVISAVALATLMSGQVDKFVSGLAFTLPYFAAGVAMFVFYRKFGTRSIGAVIAGAGLIAGGVLGHLNWAFMLFGAYLVIYFAERPNPFSRFAHRAGDLSYGVYLFGWPIEQVTQILTGAKSGELLFLYSLLPTLGIAAVSWWAVERPFMRLKAWKPRPLKRSSIVLDSP